MTGHVANQGSGAHPNTHPNATGRGLEFRILGPVEVLGAGTRLSLGGSKPRALLAMLLLQPRRAVSTDVLLDALWGEDPPASAANTLQSYVSHLRKVLEPTRRKGETSHLLRAMVGAYVLDVDPNQVDAHRFERLATEGREALASGDAVAAVAKLDDALRLWQGEPLGGLSSAPAVPAVTRLQELRVAVSADWFEAGLALGRHAHLIGDLEKFLVDDPLCERVWGQLMLALYRAGRQAEALRCFQRARRTLAEEVGIEPCKELKDLELAILRQDPALELPPASPGSGTPASRAAAGGRPFGSVESLGQPPPDHLKDVFVGRERELLDLCVGWEQARSGRGRVALVTGEAGVGKTRLARELATLVVERGGAVLWGRCWQDDGAPAFWPWTQVLRSWAFTHTPDEVKAVLGHDARYVARVLPELTELLPDVTPVTTAESGHGRFALFGSLAGVLARIARERPLVVVLEDLHSADPSSLRFLEFLCQGIEDASLLVVVTLREGEPSSAVELTPTLAALARGHGCRRLPLSGFSFQELERFIQCATDVTAAPSLVAELHRMTAGIPFFVSETVRLLAAEGRLDRVVAGSGRVRPAEPLPVTEAVRDVVRHRLSQLSPETGRVLTLAAVSGDEFCLELLQELTEVKGEALLDRLDEAVRARIVSESPEGFGRYTFSHALYRETLRKDLTASRRVFLHRRVGEALEAVARDDDGALLLGFLAHHFLESAPGGDAAKAVDYALKAAEASAAGFAYEEALGLLTRARHVLDRFLEGDDQRRCDLLLALGDAQNRLGNLEEGKQAFLEAAEAARRSGSAERLALAAVGFSAVVRTGSHPDSEGLELLQEADAAMGGSAEPARALVLSRLARWQYRLGRHAEGRALGSTALEMAKGTGDSSVAAAVLSNLHWALYGPDHIHERLALSTQVLAAGEELGDPRLMLQGHEWRLRHLLELGRMEQANEAALLLRRIAEELHDGQYLWYSAVHRAMQSCVEGRFDEAEKLALDALAAGRHLGGRHPTRRRDRRRDRPAELTQQVQLFVLRWLQGRMGEIVPELEALLADDPSDDAWLSGLALLYAEQGRELETRQVVESVAARGLANVARTAEWLPKMAALSHAVAFLRDAARAAELYTLLLPYESRNCTILEFAFFGSASHSLGLLAATMGRPLEAERHLVGALNRHQRMNSAPWVAMTEHALARLLFQRGRPGDRQRAEALVGAAVVRASSLGMSALESRLRALQAYAETRRSADAEPASPPSWRTA